MGAVASIDFAQSGWSQHGEVLPPQLRADLLARFDAHVADRAGRRSGLAHAVVRALAAAPTVRALVEPILGRAAFAFRATLFDKHAVANWLVAWHQDRMVPVHERIEAAGFGPWSDKADDGVFVQPPEAVLHTLLAVRVDLDGSNAGNGGLRLLPGTHHAGVMSRDRIAAAVAAGTVVVPDIPAGGALRLRPLVLHASPASNGLSHRRIVHIEFAPCELPAPVRFRTRV